MKNLRELLKGHEGELFYSPAFGNTKFLGIDNSDEEFPLVLEDYPNNIYLTKEGKYNIEGECILFPSKDQRDWEKWEEEQNKTMKLTDVKEKIDKWFNSKTPEEVYRILKEAGAIEDEPKTWNELVNRYKVRKYSLSFEDKYSLHTIANGEPIEKSVLAILKIHQLIEVGYGGSVSYDEWAKGNTVTVIPNIDNKEEFDFLHNPSFPTPLLFHTEEQAKEFMSYPENVELVKDYSSYGI